MKKHPYEQFNIYIDRLKHGKEEDLKATLAPDFMEIEEEDLVFDQAIEIQGQAYLTEDHLIIYLKAKTYCKMPCKVCNEVFSYPITLEPSTFTIDLEDIKGAIFNYKDILREALLLQVPPFAECHKGNCPVRGEMKKYLSATPEKSPIQAETHFPFQDLYTDSE